MNAADGKYIIIHDWMNELGLSAMEKIAYALVYSFCKKGECFNGKNAYLQEWLGCSSKHTTIGVMRSLEEKGLIVREQQMVNGKASNVYMLGAEIAPKGCKNCTKGVQKMHERGAENAPNKDIYKDNIIYPPPSKDAHAREIDTIIKWLIDNYQGTESLATRTHLISGPIEPAEMAELLEPYVREYYIGELEKGKGDIDLRGRLDILGHFKWWLPRYINKCKQEKEEQQQTTKTTNNYGSSTDPVTRAMQDLVAGMESAIKRKAQSN